MEIREDFIKNDIGIIPKDWEIKNIGSICEIYGRIGYRGYTIKDIMPQGEGAITISPSNIQDGKTDFSKCTYISWFKYDESPEIKIFNGDILLVKTGSTYGKTAIIKNLFEKATINPQLVVLKNIKVDNVFLGYMMAYKIIQNQIKSTIVGGAIPTLSQQLVANYKVPLPSTKLEQNAISTALSDADALISSLERLIEKKRNIKQGIMQKLFKHKKGWNFISLDKVVWYQEGPGVRNYQFTKNGVKLLNGTNIEKGQLFLDKTDRYISEHEAFGFYSHFLADEGDIIIACSGVTINKFDEKVTFVQREHLPLCMNTSTMRFKVINEKIDKYFFFHFLKSDSFKEQIGGKATGSAQLNFGPSHVKNIQISLPNLIEQKEIATILSDIDEEISLLENKLSKNNLIKNGMMQNLLTGKIRLVCQK